MCICDDFILCLNFNYICVVIYNCLIRIGLCWELFVGFSKFCENFFICEKSWFIGFDIWYDN